MEHNDIFGEVKGKENISLEEFTVYEWEGRKLYKKTYRRRYWPGSHNEVSDSYTCEAIV